MENEIDPRAVVLISADAEWAALSELFPEVAARHLAIRGVV